MTSPLNYQGGRQFPQSILDDLDRRLKVLESIGKPANVEKFAVKHYLGEEHPTIKGNKFDGLIVGSNREEAEEFISWVNARIGAQPIHTIGYEQREAIESGIAAMEKCGWTHRVPVLRAMLEYWKAYYGGDEPQGDRPSPLKE